MAKGWDVAMEQRQCRHCGKKYEYDRFVNLLLFCPHCRQYDYLECEYGYGPVVPCRICLGKDKIGLVTYYGADQRLYQLTSAKYGLDEILGDTYLDALYEARDILSTYIES